MKFKVIADFSLSGGTFKAGDVYEYTPYKGMIELIPPLESAEGEWDSVNSDLFEIESAQELTRHQITSQGDWSQDVWEVMKAVKDGESNGIKIKAGERYSVKSRISTLADRKYFSIKQIKRFPNEWVVSPQEIPSDCVEMLND